MEKYNLKIPALIFTLLMIFSCHSENNRATDTENDGNGIVAEDNNRGTSAVDITPDEGNGGITLPAGFRAVVVAENVGRARHITVNDNGDIYVNLREPKNGGSLVALRDTTGDGKADRIEYFENNPGTGAEIHNGYLYFSSDQQVFRYRLDESNLVPQGEREVIVTGFPSQRSHASKTFALDNSGNIYVNVGAPSNSCMQRSRTKGSPGKEPCDELERHAGIWKFSANEQNQQQMQDGQHFATGIRHAVAIGWNEKANGLYIVQHGRDQLHEFFPQHYTEQRSGELPAEEFHMIKEGDNIGWPYCYYDQLQGMRVQSPEYGGGGQKVGPCDQYKKPIMAFPGHWAPNDLIFYNGNNFPGKYTNGAFIAFHGSWNRPDVQQGYFVAFVPMQSGKPSGDFERFADGFAGAERISSSGEAEHRPMGLATGPDGSLYISDSQEGKIWRVFYTGS